MMGADHSAVDHLQGVRHGLALVQGLHDLFPEPGQRPTPEPEIIARPFAKRLGQIAPRSPCAGNPENPIKNKAVIGGFASIRGADSLAEPFKERPLLVRHQVSCQADLHRRYQLDSRLAGRVNPFCQHDPDRQQKPIIGKLFNEIKGKWRRDRDYPPFF